MIDALAIIGLKEEETLIPRDFLRLKAADLANVREARILPAKLGRNADFGGIQVKYKRPVNRLVRRIRIRSNVK